MNGILVVDKPQDYTSFDVIAVLRKKFNQKKIGHMGTLDPMATGVLPILLGSTAKFQMFTSEQEKEYVAEVKFGINTDTWDIFGKVIEEAPTNVKKTDLEAILKKFQGKINQIPPMYSAIKKNGVKLCDLARRGKVIEREPRVVEIKSLELIDFDETQQLAKIKVRCSKGTYVRSLCFDIGKELNCLAVMGNLRRTLSNSFSLEDAVNLEAIKNMSIEELAENHVFSTDYLFKNNKAVHIDENSAFKFKNGVNLEFRWLNLKENVSEGEILKLYSGDCFLGLGQADLKSSKIKFLKCE